jgi:hypothetical protein
MGAELQGMITVRRGCPSCISRKALVCRQSPPVLLGESTYSERALFLLSARRQLGAQRRRPDRRQGPDAGASGQVHTRGMDCASASTAATTSPNNTRTPAPLPAARSFASRSTSATRRTSTSSAKPPAPSYATKRHSCRRSHDSRSDEATVGVRIAARLSTVVVAIGCPCRADGLGPGGGLL